MKIKELLIGVLALSLMLSACGGGTKPKDSRTTSEPSEAVSQESQIDTETSEAADNTSEEETDGEFITEEDWNNNESIFNSGSKKAVLADETKAILDGMKTFESDVLYTWENPQDGGFGSYGELGNPFYYQTWALAETFVRAEHEKSYDLLQMYKAKADPENPLMVIELNTYTDEGTYIFPSYQNALRYTVSYQFLPEDQDKFGTDKGIGFGTPITYYLNEEEAGSVSGFVKSKERRRVYPGTYQFKLDGHENSEYKIGKSDASGGL